MANRFPLIVDSSGVAALKELPSGDNLDLTGNGIVGAGTVALTNLTVGGSQGTDGQVLTSTGSGVAWEDAAGGGGGGGRWTQIATTTISSEVHSLEFTSLGSYDEYEVRITGLEIGANSTWGTNPEVALIFDYGSGYVTGNYTYRTQYFPQTGAQAFYGQQLTTKSYPEIMKHKANISVSSPYPPAFGKVGWTSSGSQFFSKMYFHKTEEGDQGISWLHLTASNTANKQTAPTKIKFIMTNGNSVITSASEGMVSGKFTLYGLSTS
jgi:hypothetical protein